ncbi:MAG: ribosome hibernation-promoting factor, HPF/YfiA family [Candidatus Saccharimonadales bacterium]
MIQKLEIEAVHMDVDESIHEYVIRKIAKLDKYIPKAARESAHGEVTLKTELMGKLYICEVNLYLPKDSIYVKESTKENIFTAIDLVEDKLRYRIEKYKQLHGSPKVKRHLLAKFNKKAAQKR